MTQLLIDTFTYNIIECFHGISFYTGLKTLKNKFFKRKSFWIGNDDNFDHETESKLQKLQQFCYSEQYYFSITIYNSGTLLIILGILTITYDSQYFFQDYSIFYIFPIIFLLCCLFKYLTIKIGKKIKIWDMKGRGFAGVTFQTNQDLLSIKTETTNFGKEISIYSKND